MFVCVCVCVCVGGGGGGGGAEGNSLLENADKLNFTSVHRALGLH